MRTYSSLPTIIAFSAITFVFAIVAAVLPVNKKNAVIKTIDDFGVAYEYETDKEESVRPEKDSIYDFLKFSLSPAVIEQADKVVRSRQPINQKNTIIVNKYEEGEVELVRIPTSSLVVTQNVVAGSNTITQTDSAELDIRLSAMRSNSVSSCDAIENAYSAQNCRDEIYFQAATTERDRNICGNIINWKLKLRCHNYVNLTPQYETAS